METSSIAYQPASYVSSPPEPAHIPLLYRPVFWLLQCVLKFALGEQYTQDLRDFEI